MTSQTINPEEVYQFDQIADQWWDEAGPFKPLHQLNPCRLQFIKNHISRNFKIDPLSAQPLKGLKILDVGCGGGILCEPLARLGATVTGIDASPKAIETAKIHAKQFDLEINYQVASVEELPPQPFDIVCALEIIEHVDHPGQFLKACANLLSRDGLFFISTLNKTVKSYLQGIIAAEYILRLVPRGTHDWNRFVEPATLARWLQDCGLCFSDLKGFHYNPLHCLSSTQQPWSLSESLAVNYIGCAGFNSI
ncbi:bifunctional 2-polyprenyl-6-hydroxyphenol methylase/3-demethylubiquinol 3-O-methyltransferase UbiG [Candidatus Finniella inopinata]|uniref:Ubiquinone biosynthesis O-methyltransferase n=1 Tax=Candidatus Finniella inopinata TaxID=1696036 RepID=A0A4Q7DI16_9PROT|nr:bifunctional 2-polyprenyl-6-hydroxyphenol methylase/3-demethylubiquinol 3-O-methyltransferase UbiG [Candidatus Finniella inopinata]RZI45809.1 bifunctional 2-polyprenyl-6-hydroxyphenol methylase/3-demethylubiquinol 3-O-methyltransferase UbiG [Candidatus Finniella inopinata]